MRNTTTHLEHLDRIARKIEQLRQRQSRIQIKATTKARRLHERRMVSLGSAVAKAIQTHGQLTITDLSQWLSANLTCEKELKYWALEPASTASAAHSQATSSAGF